MMRFERSRDWIEKKGFENLLIVLGDEVFENGTDGPFVPLNDDFWHFDAECIEDHGSYKDIVDNLCRLARGDITFREVRDFVDVEQKIAWVEFDGPEKTDRLELAIDNDWVDPAIFAYMERCLADSGSERRFGIRDLGQDCLIACRTPAEFEALRRVSKVKFSLKLV